MFTNIYLKVLGTIILTQTYLEDLYRGHVCSQTSQALLPTAPNPNQ